ncbi:MAG: glycosyltransferase family 9 protein [Candidatus Omnitrophica bacterium]|nr:glycosyltransferase family 9 protein [Candidatus Omnitrophota bacterium]
MKRILIFELNWLGDILFSFPFIREVRRAFPSARIAVAVVSRYRGLFAGNACVDKVHVLSDSRGAGAFLEKVRFAREIAGEKYDACFFLKPSVSKGVMAFCAGVRSRIGFGGKRMFLTEYVKAPSENVHRARRLLALAGGFGGAVGDDTYEYVVPAEDPGKVDKLVHSAAEGGWRVIAFNPGGNWGAKRWPVENFICLAKGVLEKFSGVEIVVTGAKKDVGLAEKIVSGVGSERCYSVAEKTDLRVLAALYKRCALLVSADSGPIHLASAVGTTTIGIFGPTDPEVTGPRGVGKSVIVRERVDCKIPCYEEVCGEDYVCMRDVTVGKVFKAVCAELGGGNRDPGSSPG